MSDVDMVIADFHASRAERDPYDDIKILVREVERLRTELRRCHEHATEMRLKAQRVVEVFQQRPQP